MLFSSAWFVACASEETESSCEPCLRSGGTWQPEVAECTAHCDVQDIACFTDRCPGACAGDTCGFCFAISDCEAVGCAWHLEAETSWCTSPSAVQGPEPECFSPVRSPELALERPGDGCDCTGDDAVCVSAQYGGRPWNVALICDGGRWLSVEDGPCAPTPRDPSDCMVDGQRYAHGQPVPDPYSCNTCVCQDGALEACTEIHCPAPCPDGTAPSTSCAACGPSDACTAVENSCLPVCSGDDDCTDAVHFTCVMGTCRSVCG